MPCAERHDLAGGWEAAGPDGRWLAARVPQTVAGVLRDAGQWPPAAPRDLDDEEWIWRTRLTVAPAAPGEQLLLHLEGLATIATVRLGGNEVLSSVSMHLAHAVDVTALVTGDDELELVFAPLRPELGRPRRPRAKWRTRLADGGLRWWRTMLLGRAPGFADGPPAVGPWRPVWVERRAGVVVDAAAWRPRVEPDGRCVLGVRATVSAVGDAALPSHLTLTVGDHSAELPLEGGELDCGELVRWFPWTHGEPALHEAVLRAGDVVLARRHVGFRTLDGGADPEGDGLALTVNGVPVFARGAVWTPLDLVGLAPDAGAVDRALEDLRDAGMNCVRLVGTAHYEDARFHERCDALGLLVWQDLAFANFDYPVGDPDWRALVEAEVRQVLDRAAGRPSLAVVCGGSEVEQQAAMVGIDPSAARGPLTTEVVPALLAEAAVDAVWVASSPTGGALPFRFDRGVAHYFGVGGYGRPVDDARRAGVRFASECLAFANVPDEAVVEQVGWRGGTPQDHGTAWDFADVRDGYVAGVFGVDPVALRRVDVARYLELSRAVTGELMAEVLGEWRRPASPCAGAIVLWARDLEPGAGWGLVDSAGTRKAAFHHVARALAPVAVWTTDEGLAGVAVHVANDRPEPLRAALRITVLRDGRQVVDEATIEVELAPHDACTLDAEGLLGHFADLALAYRFGPPQHDAVVATLLHDDAVLAQAVRLCGPRATTTHDAAELGLEGELERLDDGTVLVRLRTSRLADGVRLHLPGLEPEDDAFRLVPGYPRVVRARPPREVAPGPVAGTVTALNLRGSVALREAAAR